MKNNNKFILVGVLVFFVAFVATLSFSGTGMFGSYAGSFGYGSGMGSMMGTPRGFGLFGAFGMLGMWLIPLLILGLIVAGIVWVVQTANKDKSDVEN